MLLEDNLFYYLFCKEMSSGRRLVILDLDNTCICAKEMSELHQVAKPEKFRHIDLEDIYRIYERPGLQEWLTELFHNFRVGIWTAAGLTYALFVIKHFIVNNDPTRVIEFVMWDDHCDYSFRRTKDQYKHVKLLEPLYNSNFTVLIDDNEDVLKQQENTIDSNYFDVTHKSAHNDTFLKKSMQSIRDYFENKQNTHTNKIVLRNKVKQLLQDHN
jgi:hypothetical protein